MIPLGHPKVKPFTREIGRGLGLDEAFLDFVFAQSRPRCFDFRVEPPDQGWTRLVPETADVAHPLWSSNGDQTLVLSGGDRVEFGHGSHDDPTFDPISRTPQGLLADLFIALYESALPLTELESAAEFAGFRHLGRAVEFASAEGADYANWDERKAAFIARIDEAESRPQPPL